MHHAPSMSEVQPGCSGISFFCLRHEAVSIECFRQVYDLVSVVALLLHSLADLSSAQPISIPPLRATQLKSRPDAIVAGHTEQCVSCITATTAESLSQTTCAIKTQSLNTRYSRTH